jgi:hypothetical protein
VSVVFDGEVVVEVEEDVEVGGRLEEEEEKEEEVDGGTEVDDGMDVGLSLGVLVGGGAVDVNGLPLGVDTEDELMGGRDSGGGLDGRLDISGS